MINKSIETISFYVLLLIFFGLALLMVWPFLKLIALAGILAVLFMPIYDYLAKELKTASGASLLVILIVIIIIAVPLSLLSQSIIRELISFYDQHNVGGIWENRKLFVNNLPPAWQQTAANLVNSASARISVWAEGFVLNITDILSNVVNFFFSCFIILFSVFFFLKDHKKIKQYLENLFPLSSSQEDLIIIKIVNAINGVVQGSFMMALIQGSASTIGFFLAGLPQPLFWGCITVISSFIPTVGTSLVIVPAIIYLFMFKSFLAGIVLAVWYIVVHLSIDNILGPKLIGSKIKMHPLLVVFSVVGGLQLFGPLGFLFGPIIMAIFVALIEVRQAALSV